MVNVIKKSEPQVDRIIGSLTALIEDTAKDTLPKILSQLAKEIFDSKGTTHGRQWDENSPSTARAKGKNHRNVDTGLLQDTLEQPGFLLDDDYMERLPQTYPDRNYKYANYSPNKFDDIGRTNDDEKYIEAQIEVALQEAVNKWQ
jgi:hypothetical protein